MLMRLFGTMKTLPSTLHPALAAIVAAELEAGNTIVQVDERWPRPGCLTVHLGRAFILHHQCSTTVGYFEDHDPHGPFAEYCHLASGQAVLCSMH